MENAADRLVQARKRAGYPTATDAARAFGWNENTYRSHENGVRGLQPRAAQRYGRAFRVSPAWLLTGEGLSLEREAILRASMAEAFRWLTPRHELIPELVELVMRSLREPPVESVALDAAQSARVRSEIRLRELLPEGPRREE